MDVQSVLLFLATEARLFQILFVLIIIFSFAPVLVWAERRQSAMVQDRIGPVRAGFVVPPIVKEITSVLALLAITGFIAGVFIAITQVRQDPPAFGTEPHWWDWIAAVMGNAWFGITLVGMVVHLLLHMVVAWLADSRTNVALFGLLHPLADALKFVFKEDFVPPKADKFLHSAAPIITLIPAIVTFAVVPFGGLLYWEHVADYAQLVDGVLVFSAEPQGAALASLGEAIPLQVASLNVGILFLFAVAGTGVVGAAIAGYASDNKFALLGGLRAAGQMVSYEVTLGLTLVPAFMLYGTVLPEAMVQWQTSEPWFGLIPRWGIIPLLPSFILFLTCSIAETKRIPFDLPEAESELVAGYFTEYSGMKFGMFFMAEFIEVVVLSTIISTLFLGGYGVPFLTASGFEAFGYILNLPHGVVILIHVLSFVTKLILLIWLQLQI
ncbi:MAG: NADH-quinone oxidoreductase subunit H, partial [Myxococcales bacterium]|nr:NADH-quinone oxidoreductase subunit H [Myxococcales bacterium]